MSKKELFLGLVVAVVLMLMTITSVLAGEVADIQRAIRSKGADWVAGETSMTKLPPAERMKFAGLVLPRVTGKENLLSPTVMALPAYLDWRDNGGTFVTPVRSQGSCASCWAFATTAALEAVTLIAGHAPGANLDLAEQVLLSCSGAGNCEVGGSIDSASNYLRDSGLPMESCYPYSAVNGNCASTCANWHPAAYKAASWNWVATTSPTVQGIKSALFTKGPLVTTMAVYDDFYAYVSGIYRHTTGNLAGNHAVLIVGYDDIEQYFSVKNSWGTGWGESGYFKIAYSEMNTVVNFGDYTIAYTGFAPACLAFVSHSFGSEGGTGNVNVSVPSGCSWVAASNDSWITINSGSSGTGDGMVVFSVLANGEATSRSGSLTIAGQLYPVTQAALVCTYSISPTNQSFGSTGGTGSVSVTATSGCSWTAASNAAWITVTSGSSGLGSGTVGYSVASNTDSSTRTGALTIAGNTFTVSQGGSGGVPDISVNPTFLNFGTVSIHGSSTKPVTISNVGMGSLVINSFTFEGGSGKVAYRQTNDCRALAPGESCTVNVSFKPTLGGHYQNAYLAISSNDPDENPLKVLCQGRGTY